ncbi:hypothetical protein SAMN05428642_101305 [Flaviramulus basaltis]|uniref:Collagen-binding domain of a collagenase n=2 Tax=Flaviramulus basaltis TaxID=369401 RepID=A0A1K2IAL7_9FLAO|nr:hypothetical protein SAMN05428642_101305 [Flaviramulus basaltis]
MVKLMKTVKIETLLVFLFVILSCSSSKDKGIEIRNEHPNYWTYNCKPTLLLGGSNDDNLFQWPIEKLVPHLDSMVDVGANYVRNTMSDRKQKGFEIYPFKELPNKKYDLDQWSDEYWNRFTVFLEETAKRNIIVQIEIWDRFDFSREEWKPNPYNPINNVSYTYDESGFVQEYPKHPGKNAQPFFFTTPNQRKNTTVFKYQKAYVDKLLSISLKYNNVLYCIDNETSAEEAWATYWAQYIKEKAGDKKIYVTEMWNAHDLTDDEHKRTFDHPELYDYVDISQNSWNKGYENWLGAQKVKAYLSKNTRPINHVKIYGASTHKRAEEGINSSHAAKVFLRNIVGGLASSRFHRPTSGLGLSRISINCIKSVRMVEEKVKFWDLRPNMKLLLDCDYDEAYLTANPDKSYLVYFTGKGSVDLDLSQVSGSFRMYSINIQNASWAKSTEVKGKQILKLTSEYENGSFIILTKQ